MKSSHVALKRAIKNCLVNKFTDDEVIEKYRVMRFDDSDVFNVCMNRAVSELVEEINEKRNTK